jgi:hypothetical protein
MCGRIKQNDKITQLREKAHGVRLWVTACGGERVSSWRANQWECACSTSACNTEKWSACIMCQFDSEGVVYFF